jgi:tetratricopeptide (TPR) repeat protein
MGFLNRNNGSRAIDLQKKGLSLQNSGRFDEAIECYDKALEIGHGLIACGCMRLKGDCLKSLGRLDEAINCQHKALNMQPQGAIGWQYYGNLLRFRCSSDKAISDKAIKCYDKAIELLPRNSMIWLDKGACLKILDRFDEAIKCYDKAIELCSQGMDLFIAQGDKLRKSDPGKALEFYEMAHHNVLQNVGIWRTIGDIQGGLHRPDEANKCYERAKELEETERLQYSQTRETLEAEVVKRKEKEKHLERTRERTGFIAELEHQRREEP